MGNKNKCYLGEIAKMQLSREEYSNVFLVYNFEKIV